MKTLDRITWDKIKINEVFAVDLFNLHTDFDIFVMTENGAMLLDTTFSFNWNGNIFIKNFFGWKELYKLSLSDQRLWRQDI